MRTNVTPGVYAHYKDGALYRVLFTGYNSTNGEQANEPLVIYVSMTTGMTRVRTVEEFNESVRSPTGAMVPRFRLLTRMV